jgi:hypothetical protein
LLLVAAAGMACCVCRFIIGLPLFQKNAVEMCQQMIGQAKKYLGSSVIGFELGNEVSLTVGLNLHCTLGYSAAAAAAVGRAAWPFKLQAPLILHRKILGSILGALHSSPALNPSPCCACTGLSDMSSCCHSQSVL